MAETRRMHLRCDCGCDELMCFGPYPQPGEKDDGLRWILTCSKCGEQLRIYQTSDAWRARHGGDALQGVPPIKSER